MHYSGANFSFNASNYNYSESSVAYTDLFKDARYETLNPVEENNEEETIKSVAFSITIENNDDLFTENIKE